MRCDYQLIHASLLAMFTCTHDSTCGALHAYAYDYRPNHRYNVYVDNSGSCEVYEDTEAMENVLFRAEYPDMSIDELLLVALGVITTLE